MTRTKLAALACAAAFVVAACGGDDDTESASDAPGDSVADTTPDDTAPDTTAPDSATPSTATPDEPTSTEPASTEPTEASDSMAVLPGEPFPDERCAANEEAGTINYYSGFDYAAAASILEVLVAEQAGYYDELCLDVEITPSFSTANYALVAAGEAQFSSSGSFSELATQAAALDADLVAMSVDGYVAIDVLMVKPDRADSLADLEGQTIGIKGALPPAVAVMLSQEAGLVEGDDYQTALLDGFDPFAHWAIPDIAALPGWRSNEPGALERGGETFDLYDPADYGVPGSFGLIYTSRDFLQAHPTAAEDFMRATLRGLADGLADPEAAAALAFELVEANDNPNFLSAEGETFRWVTDAETILASLPEGAFPGMPVGDELDAQVAAYAEVGFYGDEVPSTTDRYDLTTVAGLYDANGEVIWPG
jgi:NitT/TauT family transport system substrate-binding protein